MPVRPILLLATVLALRRRLKDLSGE